MNIKTLFGYRFRSLILTLAVMMSLSVVGVISAQEETPEAEATEEMMAEMPESLVVGLEEVSEEFPELADVEWIEYSDREITLWLPESFELTPIEDMIEMAEMGSELLDPQLRPFVDMLAANPDLIRMVVLDGDTITTGFATNMIIVREPNRFELDAVDYAEATVNLFPPSVTVREEPEEVEIEGFESVVSAQWTVETAVTDVVSLVYIIANEDYIYTINLSTSPERADFDVARLDLAMQTLVIDSEQEGEA